MKRFRSSADGKSRLAADSSFADPVIAAGNPADRTMPTIGPALEGPTSAIIRPHDLAARSRAAVANAGEIEIAGRRYLTAHRLSSTLGVTVRTLARWNASGIGPPKISIGKTILFDLTKLPAWLSAREIQPTRNRGR
jgi:hypothetical protein